MTEKPDNVFSKLDEQSEKIDDISEKLEGISINDLYALAKRTWDYGDFQTAQKYYNHISLLHPLDWEAPLYASLCNFKGYHDMFFWTKVPEQEGPIFVSTIQYINNLDLEKDKKEAEMSKCIQILEKSIASFKDHYFKYQKEYDQTDPNYIHEYQEWFVDIIEKINDIDLESLKPFKAFLSSCCLEIGSAIKSFSLKIDKEKYAYLVSLSEKEWDIDYDVIIKRQERLKVAKENALKNLTQEEKNTILLNGKMFFEYGDKVVAKRVTRNKIIFGLGIVIFSSLAILFSFLSIAWFAIPYSTSVLIGVLLLIKAFVEKDVISCSSLLSDRRKKCRLTSNGAVVKEDRLSFFKIITIICLATTGFLSVFFSVALFTDSDAKLPIKILFCISAFLCSVFQYAYLLKSMSRYDEGFYKYLYNGKFYTMN